MGPTIRGEHTSFWEDSMKRPAEKPFRAKAWILGGLFVACVAAIIGTYAGYLPFRDLVNAGLTHTQITGYQAIPYIALPLVGFVLITTVAIHTYCKYKQRKKGFLDTEHPLLLHTLCELKPSPKQLAIGLIVLTVLSVIAMTSLSFPEIGPWMSQAHPLWQTLAYVGGTAAAMSGIGLAFYAGLTTPCDGSDTFFQIEGGLKEKTDLL
jgi:hypothetical protein